MADTQKALPAPAGKTEIELRGPDGEETGVTVRLGPAPDEPIPDDEGGVKNLAARVTGWSTMKVDGETFTHSKARALELLVRFPWIAAQVRAGTKDAAA